MIVPIFPCLVYHERLAKRGGAALNQALLEECYAFAEEDEAGQRWSEENYLGGYTSYSSLDEMHRLSPTFGRLRRLLDRHIKAFVEALQWDVQGRSLKMTTCWINIMPQYTAHSAHIHPLSVVSGTYYVQTPETCSAIRFEDPRAGLMMAAPPRRAGADPAVGPLYSIQPQAGHVVLFESWMRHEVPPNPTEQERVSVSFNYDWR